MITIRMQFSEKDMQTLIEEAYKIIRPVSPLKSFVARNPLGSLDELAFDEAVKEGYHYFQQKKFPRELDNINRETIKWSEVFFDNSQASLRMPDKSIGFYLAWKKLAIFDKRLHLGDISKVRFLEGLPDKSENAIFEILKCLQIPKNAYLKFLIQILTTLPGWAGYAKYLSEFSDSLIDKYIFIDYLAIRLIITYLFWPNAIDLLLLIPEENPKIDDILLKIKKSEFDYRKNLINLLQAGLEDINYKTKKTIEAQLIFCLDARSEAIRKYLEKSGNYETFGCAGFFGLPISVQEIDSEEAMPSCPSMIKPKHIIEVYRNGLSAKNIDFRDQCKYAEKILKTIGLVNNFASLVIICGHGAQVKNNPHAKALNCGACSGRHGKINAQILSRILNDVMVRQELKTRGIEIAQNTVFIAANHNTTTDEVEIYVQNNINTLQNKILEELNRNLEIVRKINASKRLEQLDKGKSFYNSIESAKKRSSDWSQPRAEWGLAKNASFIIGPRVVTENIDLKSRAFLQSYEWEVDFEGNLLEEILSGPMLLAHSINTQYLFSTLDNIAYGAGSKVTQNVTGKFGIMQGNASDLMYGLPLQAVYSTDTEPYHEPIRLTVVVYAPRQFINKAINQQSTLQKLIRNSWITLLGIDPNDHRVYQIERDFSWTVVNE